eukprot:TRINITY_DN1354_c0_g1_i1.p1 TRINITY_DN1354_c0_g1~~TRINITY_DN1354_c0_g1_i1.p1  ORF type:complete len:208 (-),score=45.45 TRINITY_DN1354_c0_g1_i1:170-748(-)
MAFLRASFVLLSCTQLGFGLEPVADDAPKILSSALEAVVGETEAKAIQPDVLKDCLSEGSGAKFNANVFTGIDMLMQQRGKKVRRGLFHISSGILSLLAEAESKCGADVVKGSVLIANAQRLKDLTDKKGNVEYKVKERLVVGGVDIHKTVNAFIGSWKNYVSADGAGKMLGQMLGAFTDKADKEKEVKTEL